MTLAAYPFVPRDEVGFRMQVTAANTDEEIDVLITVLEALAAAGELRVHEHELEGRGLNGPPRPPHARRPRVAPGMLFLAAGVVLLGVYLFVKPFAGSAPVMNLLGLAPVVATSSGVRHCTGRQPRPGPWGWFALGFALFWLGDVYTYSYPRLLGTRGAVPVARATGPIVAVYPALMAGLFLLATPAQPSAADPRGSAIDAADHDGRPGRCRRGCG